VKRLAMRGIAWSLVLGIVAWAGVAEARRDYNPWTEARRDLERAAHALEGIDSQRARKVREDVDSALSRVRNGEKEWTPPASGGGARRACADEVVRRLNVHEEDVRVQRESGNAKEGVRVNWWAHKSHSREKAGYCVVQRGEISKFQRY
jgi:hypothetical protein